PARTARACPVVGPGGGAPHPRPRGSAHVARHRRIPRPLRSGTLPPPSGPEGDDPGPSGGGGTGPTLRGAGGTGRPPGLPRGRCAHGRARGSVVGRRLPGEPGAP